ncbi:MAG: cupin domain-containing protein [Planctomycetes bacterium]|nr:cupin domain-containing protein [Planctomycetota bacterium]
MQVVDLADKLARISEHWRPKIVAELNGQEVKLAKLQGEFVWHTHAAADELFLVVTGELRVDWRDAAGEHSLKLRPGQLVVVPRGVEHRTAAELETACLIFEPADVLNTGDVVDAKLTAPRGARI